MHHDQVSMIELQFDTRRCFSASAFLQEPRAEIVICGLAYTAIDELTLESLSLGMVLAPIKHGVFGENHFCFAVAMIVLVFHADEHGGLCTQRKCGDGGTER